MTVEGRTRLRDIHSQPASAAIAAARQAKPNVGSNKIRGTIGTASTSAVNTRVRVTLLAFVDDLVAANWFGDTGAGLAPLALID